MTELERLKKRHEKERKRDLELMERDRTMSEEEKKKWLERRERDRNNVIKCQEIKDECPTPGEYNEETWRKLHEVDCQASYYYAENFRTRAKSPFV